MNRTSRPFAIVAAISASLLLAAEPSSLDPIRNKSIFSKDRYARRSYTPATSYAPVRNPVLIGVARDEDRPVALLEIPSLGTVKQLHIGDAMPSVAGTLTKVTLDYIEYCVSGDGQTTRVYVGQDVHGAIPESPHDTATSQPAAGANTDIQGDDLLSRMRRRRMQEMNR